MNAAVASSMRATPWRAYAFEARNECLRYLRSPGFLLPTLLFPAVFYLMFGVLLGRPGSDAARYLLAAYGTFGVMGPGLFGFGISFAMERENGLLTLKRAMPMPALAYLAAKMLMAMMMSAAVLALLVAIALTIAKVAVTPGQIAALFAWNVPGALPFCALGLLLGTLASGQGSAAVINMIYLPMAFLSGLWLPLSALPQMVQAIAPVLPSYHLNALALDAVGVHRVDALPHVAVLLAFTAVTLALAVRRLRRTG